MNEKEMALVCEWLGISPRGYEVDKCFFYSREFADRAAVSFGVPVVILYPNLLDWAGFGLMVEALKERKRGYIFVIRSDGSVIADMWDTEDGVNGPTLPEALAKACLELARRERS